MKCCVCGKDIQCEEPALLFVSENEEERLLCDECEVFVQLLENSINDKERETAIKSIKEKSKNCDKETEIVLSELIANAEGLTTRASVQTAQESETQQTADKTPLSDMPGKSVSAPSGNGWISILKGFIWFFMIAGILASVIVGIVLIADGWMEGLGITLLTVGPFAIFLSCAFIMVFLQMAEDVSAIKKKLLDK